MNCSFYESITRAQAFFSMARRSAPRENAPPFTRPHEAGIRQRTACLELFGALPLGRSRAFLLRRLLWNRDDDLVVVVLDFHLPCVGRSRKRDVLLVLTELTNHALSGGTRVLLLF